MTDSRIVDVFAGKRFADSYSAIQNRMARFLRQLLLQLAGERTDWYRKLILKKDVPIYNQTCGYDAHMILPEDYLCSLFGVVKGSPIEETHIAGIAVPGQELAEHLDLAALCKALEKTVRSGELFCNWLGKNSYEECKASLRSFYSIFLGFRNATSHSSENVPEQEVLHQLEEIRAALTDTAVKTAFEKLYPRLHGDFSLFDELQTEISEVIADARLFLDGYTIDQTGSAILDRRHLRNYAVVTDEWALQGKYRAFLLQEVVSCCELSIFQTTNEVLERTYSEQKYNNPEEPGTLAYNCKEALRALASCTANPNFHCRKSLKYNGREAFTTRDNILTLLDQAPDKRICVVLGEREEALAEEIIARGNPNHVALRITGMKTATPFHTAARAPEAAAPAWRIAFLPENAPSASGQPEPAQAAISAQAPENSLHAQAQPELAPSPPLPSPAPAQTALAQPEQPTAVYGEEPGIEIYIPRERDVVSYDPGGNYRVTLTAVLGNGAEGTVYENDLQVNRAIKIYEEAMLTDARIRKLKAMHRFYKEQKKTDASCFRQICWPAELVYSMGHIVGYAMDRVPNACSLEELLTNLQTSDDLSEDFPVRTRSDLLDVCIRIAEGFDRLHGLPNVLMGDVNPKNLLVAKDARGKIQVWFVDVDSYQFSSEPCPVGRVEFFSKRLVLEVRKTPSLKNILREDGDEKAALAALFFYVLFLRRFPYDTTNDRSYAQSIVERRFVLNEEDWKDKKRIRHDYIWQNLTPELRDMFLRAFGGGKNRAMYYPSELEWKNAFIAQKSRIVDSRRYSNEIYPTSALYDEEDAFIRITCKLCGRQFEISKKEKEREEESDRYLETDLCPNCKSIRSLLQGSMDSRTCTVCGRRFAINQWDCWIEDVCPDCDQSIQYSRKNEFNQTDFPEKLRSKVTDALKNLAATEE